MSTNNGGPAFPANHFDLADGEHGISTRDYFAAKAMQAFITVGMGDVNGLQRAIRNSGARDGQHWIAMQAYSVADEMIKQREAGK